jgi:TolB-like protein
MPEDRRLAAIMFTDIVGYTAKAFKVLRKNRGIQRPIIKKYRGEWLKEMGDGILASFSTSSDAVRCAGEIQQATKKENIALRIGIHEGEVVFEGGDVLGDGVNVASRLEEMADEGCINISGAVYKDIKNKTGITAEFIKEQELKNVEEPVKVYRVHFEEQEKPAECDQPQAIRKNNIPYYIIAGLVVVIATILIWQFLPINDDSSLIVDDMVDKSIAVLPFKDDSKEKDNQYFCDGMMETILNHLVKIGDLKVMSRTDVEPYRDTQKSRKEIASELGVANILEGSVFKMGNRFRISVQLINPETGFHLWSDAYEGEYTEEIFTVQGNIARKVALALNAVITPEEESRIDKKPTSDIRAYEKYIKGRESLMRYYNYRDKKDFEMAENLYRESLEIDPKFSWGYSGLAEIFSSGKGSQDSVYYYAEKAIEYDHYNSWGYVFKGSYFREKGDFDKALDSYKKAIEVDPNNPWIYETIWQLYFQEMQDFRRAKPYLKKAKELQIKQKYSLAGLNNRVGRQYFHIGDYEKTKQYFKSSLEIKPTCSIIMFYTWLIRIDGEWGKALDFLDSITIEVPICAGKYNLLRFRLHVWKKEFDQAEQYMNLCLEDGIKLSMQDSIAFAYMYKELGKEKDALTILNSSRISYESQLAENANFYTYLYLSVIHAILDEEEKALNYLFEAVDIGTKYGWGWHDFIEIYPPFENLWDDPEFKAIVKRAQDEKAAIRAQVREAEEHGELDL